MAQVDRTMGLIGNVAMKAPVRLASTAPLGAAMSGLPVIDSVQTVAGDRILRKDESDASLNGIWTADSAIWNRAQDFDGPLDAATGTLVLVTEGTVYTGSMWEITTLGDIDIGTTLIDWANAMFSSSATTSFIAAGVAAVQRTSQDKMRDIVSAFDFMTDAEITAVKTATYGAVTDVTTALQAALDATADAALYMPPGTYRTADTLAPSSNTLIGGAGAATIIESNSATALTFEAVDQTNITLRDFKVTGINVAVSQNSTFKRCDRILVENIIFDLAFPGSLLNQIAVRSIGSDHMTIRDCTFFDTTGAGAIYLTRDSETDTGAIVASSAGSITLAATASAVNNAYLGMIVKASGGSNTQPFKITAYDGATKVATVSTSAMLYSTLGLAQAGGAADITLATEASSANDTYNTFTVTILTGTGAGQERVVSAYVGATRVATVSVAWVTPPDGTSTYAIGPLPTVGQNYTLGPNTGAVKVINCHFENKVLGTNHVPVGIYQVYGDHLLVDGCTFKDILGVDNATTDIGYSVYEGDGYAETLTVVNSRCKVTTAAYSPHVLVNCSSALKCVVANNIFEGTAMGLSGTFHQLFRGGGGSSQVLVQGNISSRGGISINNAGPLIAGKQRNTQSVLVHDNQLFSIEQESAAIWLGYTTHGVQFASLKNNVIYGCYHAGVRISGSYYTEVEGNRVLNWNILNNVGVLRASAFYWEGDKVGTFIGNMTGNTPALAGLYFPGQTLYGLSSDTAVALGDGVIIKDNVMNDCASADYSNFTPWEDSGTWTPSVGGTATYTGTPLGIWKRTGKRVQIHFDLTINAIGTGSANVISGLPASVTTTYANGVAIGILTGAVATGLVHLGGYTTGTSIQLVGMAAAASDFTNVNPLISGTRISGSASYLIP